MADTLERLQDALRDRDHIKESISKLERTTDTGSAAVGSASKHEKQTQRLSSADKQVSTIREVLAAEIDASRTAAAAAGAGLQELEALHRSGEIADEPYQEKSEEFRSRREEATARIAVRERALSAESARDLDWLESVPIIHRVPEGETPAAPAPCEVRLTDWPGASVPERIAMLWREARKPNSRRSIITSAIAVGALTVIVIAVVLIAGKMNPKDASDYLRPGEVLVPVLVDSAEHIRNLEFTLVYDTETVTGMSVIQGDVGRLAVMQYDIHRAGTVEVSIRDVVGVSGSGSIVIMRFRANEAVPDHATLSFASLRAVDTRTMEERPVVGEDGWIDTETLDVLAPIIRFP